MNIQKYTTAELTNMAHELNLDLHDSALPYILARHIFTLENVTTGNNSLINYESILIHTLKSFK